ncbi:MAG TPA: hypothetical protein VIH61_06220, partial [Waddliaceae bacterium]
VFARNYINRAILSGVLGVFSVTYAIPLPALTAQYTLNDAAFVIRMEKLISKLMKLEKSDNKDKMYNTIVDIKAEIENSYGVSLDIGKGVHQVEQLIKNAGFTPLKKEFDAMRKALKKKDKKRKKHVQYVASTMHLEGYEFNEDDEMLMMEGKHDKDKDREDNKEEEADVPAQLVFGVTLTLCGVFLMAIPIPACKLWGERMIQSGVLVCGNYICGKIEDDKKKCEC